MPNHVRKFIDLIRKVSGKWASWDPPIPITVGSYGTLDENGEFDIDGNIYSDEFQRWLDDNGYDFTIRKDYRPRLAEPDEDYIAASSGVIRKQINVDPQVNAAIMSARIKGTWKFRDGKRGALIILLSPRQSFIPNDILGKICDVEPLRGKYLVTSALTCPAYLMYLSNKSGEDISVAFCAKGPSQGGAVDTQIRGEWWTENEAGLLRRGAHPIGEYLFTPLFSLKQTTKRPLFAWRMGEEEFIEEFKWEDTSPTLWSLDKDGEGKFADLIHRASGKWTNWDPPIPVALGDFGTLDKKGKLVVDGNIYGDKFQQYLERIGVNLELKAYPAKFSGFDQDYIVASSGGELDVDQNSRAASAPIEGTWKFEDGERGALAILVAPHEISIQQHVLTVLLKAKRLNNKHLVTTVYVCPAYLMYLSNPGEAFSVTFDPSTSGVETGWWTDAESALLRKGCNVHGESRFVPLFSLQHMVKESGPLQEGEKEREHVGNYAWHDVYPTWSPLDEDGEEYED